MTTVDDSFHAPKIYKFELKFDELRARMAEFRVRFDNHISQNTKLLVERRQRFEEAYSESKRQEEILKAEIESCNNLALQNAEAKAMALDELDESKHAIVSYTQKRDEISRSYDALQQEITRLREEVKEKRGRLDKQKQDEEFQAALNGPELRLWEQTLGLRVEGASRTDFVRFVFTLIDKSDGNREYSIVLDLREYNYKVAECVPVLSQAQVDLALGHLNESRQINVFLSEIRRAFKSL